MPLVEAIRAHVFAAERIHADDTTVPVLDIGQDAHRATMDLRARRPAVRRRRPAGGGLLLLARPRAASIPRRTWRRTPG